MKQFVNLHAHSIGSLLDGASKPAEYMERALELNQPMVTFTEHGTLNSLIENYKAAQDLGIPYAPGLEAYRARKSRFDNDPEELSGKATSEWEQRGPYHQTIIAVNNVGYQNLLKLSSDSYLTGYLRKPRIDLELIDQYSEGLVVLSGCMAGAVHQALLRGDYDAALNEAATMQEIVGKDNYFIEIMDHGIPEENAVHDQLISIAKRIGAPIVPTCDSHYTHPSDACAHDHMLCVNTGSLVSQVDRFKFHNDQFYLKSYDEMAQLFPEEWVDNTLLVYDKLDFKLDFDQQHYPIYEIPQESSIKVISDYFVEEIRKGATAKFGPNWQTERRDVAERLNEEISVIQDMGYDSYFLIVADIIEWCRQNDILSGPGRGSAASSMVAYCLGITYVEPLRFNLLFERFLTPGRVPDIDIDIDDRYRGRVMDYIRQKYGDEKTARIVTITNLKAKSAVRDISRVRGKPFDFGNKICDAMPPAQYGVTKTLSECMESEEFRHLYESDEEVKDVVDLAFQIENVWRSDGIHAGGIIVADDNITNYCPVQKKGEDEPVVTQWDMRTAELVGLLKIDLLSLGNLGIIENTLSRVGEDIGIDITNVWSLAENPDPEVFKFLSEGHTAQVFQLGSDGLTSLVKTMGIHSIDDIIAAVALYRPGPMGSGFHISYPKRKHKLQKPTPLHPLLEELLAPTYGILLYQEQVMAISKDIAGFDPTAANKFLKSIGKKDRAVMAATKGAFVEGCVNHGGISEKEAEDLFAAIEPHADYSFSAAHAAAYAYVSYVTAYLAYYYPAEYSAACLSSAMLGDEKSFRPVLNDIREKMGVEVLPPSVNDSRYDFNVKDDKVLYSIAGLKGVGKAKSSAFVEQRDKVGHEYTDLYDFLRTTNVDVIDKTFIESLIYSGALDDLVGDDVAVEADISTEIELLVKEMETIGLSVTGDLFATYYHALDMSDKALPISQIETTRSKYYCGVIKDPEIKVSKAGRRFAKFRVDDNTDIYECLILGKTVAKVEEHIGKPLEEILVTGNFITLAGRVNDNEDEENNIYLYELDEYHSPSSVGDQLNSVSFNIRTQKDRIYIEEVLKANPGTTKVYFYNIHPDLNIAIKESVSYTVNVDSLDKLNDYKRKVY